MTTSIQRLAILAAIAFGLAGCGGGGGGGGDVVTPPPPPPPTFTYSVELVDLDMTDLRDNSAIDATGLPVAGAVATRQ